MNKIDHLLKQYGDMVALPWKTGLSGAQKTWFLVYDKQDERRIRLRIGDFELATKKADHGWMLCDLTDEFPRWMAAHEYRESYFESPEDLELALEDFLEYLKDTLTTVLNSEDADEQTVVALVGVSSLFGLVRVSNVIEKISGSVKGRLLVFFPGEYDQNTYRLLDARDGWNYLAVPIT